MSASHYIGKIGIDSNMIEVNHFTLGTKFEEYKR